jgi:Ca2+-binding RTX toxin-like protein
VGGSGNDMLIGGSAVDSFYGDIGNDELIGNDGNDNLHGQEGSDRVHGGNGNDTITGGIDDDFLFGELGNDRLTGNEGNDELHGEEGNDQLLGLDGNDRLLGGSGNDNLQGGLENDQLFGGADDDELYGHDGNDSLYGEDGTDVLTGNAGDDLLSGGAGGDQLVGDEGRDQLYGDAGSDRLFGLAGDDHLYGGVDNDYLSGGADNDKLVGDAGVDELYGGDGSDTLQGLDGDDLLNGGVGNDRMWGGKGNDELVGEDGNDELNGEAGNDRLLAGDGNDKLVGAGGNDYLVGGDGNDRLFGGVGHDELIGQAGKDRLYGQAGNDILLGGLDNDLLGGGAGIDQLTGHEGNDEMYGEDGDDRLFGSEGNDLLNGGLGNDALIAGAGNDQLFGRAGNDELTAGDGIDILVGDEGDDLLDGGVGSDVLIGGDDIDELIGQWGDDILIGGVTSHDRDRAKLSALALAWSSAAPYSTRIQQIESEGFSARLMSNVTIFDDEVADEVFGGDGQDWFFQTGVMGVYDPNHVHSHDHAHHEESSGHGGHQHPVPVISDEPPALEGFELVSAIDKFGDRQRDEAIQSKLPHADEPVLQREHLTLFQLVRYDEVTHYAVQAGAWSDPTTWHDGMVPSAGARVLIPINVSVSVDGVIQTRLSSIRVDGTLTFDTQTDTELPVDTVVVSGSGRFQMGDEVNPIAAGVTARLIITDEGPIDRAADPFALGRGLLSHGSVSIVGAEVTSYVSIASAALAGAQVLTLGELPVGWKVGDTVVVAATTAGTQQNEVRQITSILGNSVVLNQPLSYSHVPARADLKVHLANVTRNAVIESESSAVDRRGHVMFMHNDNVNVAYAGFYRLGRTDKTQAIDDSVVDTNWALQADSGTNPRGRYSVHFHRTGTHHDDAAAVIQGSAVVDSAGWGFVNHSSNVDMIKNVAFDVHGAAFTTEAGDEIGSFQGNLAIGTSGSGQSVEARKSIHDFGHGGEGFWFQGVGIKVTDNIAAGNDGTAYLFFARGLVEGGVKKEFVAENLPDSSIANGAETIDIGKMAVFQFQNNIGYASAEGLATWYHMENAADGHYGVFQNSIFWNNTLGVNLGYTQHTELHNLTVIHAPQATQPMLGLSKNAVTRDIIYNNLTVEGYRIGIYLPTIGDSVVNGGRFNNATDIYIRNGSRNALLTGFNAVPRIAMVVELGTQTYLGQYFAQDVVTLDFGPFASQRLYYMQQAADAIPFPRSIEELPPGYVGLTNQQLWDQYGVALGGEVAPGDVYTVSNITGLIGRE